MWLTNESQLQLQPDRIYNTLTLTIYSQQMKRLIEYAINDHGSSGP